MASEQDKKMTHLFVYGTLMFDTVWRRLLPAKYHKLKATLQGYQRLNMSGEVYPGLKPGKAGRVDGVLMLDLSAHAIAVLDRFEGPCYRRQAVSVTAQSGQIYHCEVYVTCEDCRHMLSATPWHADEFQTRHLRRFIASFG